MAGSEVARPFVQAAESSHPSLIDQTHYMDSRFGVTNIPQVLWIDESSTIVRPPEPGSPLPVGEAALEIAEIFARRRDRRGLVGDRDVDDAVRDLHRHRADLLGRPRVLVGLSV